MSDSLKEETLTIAWCDGGLVDGKFMQGVTDVMLHGGVKVVTTLRSNGNQIARQREKVINHWFDNNKSDWILWVDSDVVISPEKFKLLWDNRESLKRPIVTGVYFTSDQPEESLMTPAPTVFKWVRGKETITIARVNPLPKNVLMQVGAAGMGFVLMHRNAIAAIKKTLPDTPLFTEVNAHKQFTGEDIYFFSLCDQVGVPVWCHTGATVPHMKRFSFDENYYDAFMAGDK